MRLCLLLAFSFALIGCASKTRIYTLPAGADLTLDDKKVLGKSPVEYKETVWIWTKHKVTAKLDGHSTRSITIKNNGMNGAGFAACACTVGLLLPFMFVSEYQPQYLIELEENPSKTPETDEQPLSASKINFIP